MCWVGGLSTVHAGVRQVRPGSLGSLECALGTVLGRGFHWSAPWVSSGSSTVIRVRPGGRQVPLCSLCSLGGALVIVGIIRVCWVHWSALRGS